ncbi:TPA: IS4-like element ISPa12 family transposase, partial [Acinetobacter baumannii]|nr:IS4-like element ISPa12 family transposase [Acinetobacter baumannii]HAV4911703.1 IS4-like element ISPa12 family transposase [Acinetobacter baumannii]
MKQNQITAFSTIFEALFSEQQLNSLGVQTHMIERFRLITPAKLCLAFVCALGSGNARTIADIHRYFNHLHSMSVRLKPFHNQLVKLGTPEFMRQVFEQALALHLPAMHTFSDAYRGHFKQVLLQDGTSFAVHDGLSLHFPGRFSTHSPAAVELHVTYDLEKAQPVRVSLSEDTASERDYLPVAQSLRGCLLMADAGYFSKAYIESLQNEAASFVLRMPASVNPMATCNQTGLCQPLRSWLAVLPKHGELDLDVQWPDGPVYRCVLFASTDHKDKPVCLCTNLDRHTFPAATVGEWYRLRWQIELLFKEWKSLNSLNKFNTEYSTIAETLIWGSLLAATLKRWLINGAQQKYRRV